MSNNVDLSQGPLDALRDIVMQDLRESVLDPNSDVNYILEQMELLNGVIVVQGYTEGSPEVLDASLIEPLDLLPLPDVNDLLPEGNPGLDKTGVGDMTRADAFQETLGLFMSDATAFGLTLFTYGVLVESVSLENKQAAADWVDENLDALAQEWLETDPNREPDAENPLETFRDLFGLPNTPTFD